MQQNIGTVDRYLRLTSGILILTGGLQMRRASLAKSALLAVGAMKITEGITGWCPLLSAFGVTTLEEGSNAQSSRHKQDENQRSNQPATDEANKGQADSQNQRESGQAQLTDHHSRNAPKQSSDGRFMHEGTEHHEKSHERHEKQHQHSSESRSPERRRDETNQEILYS